jgi:hypothetical protein
MAFLVVAVLGSAVAVLAVLVMYLLASLAVRRDP